ncbi:tRNA preQ1(34) S-adenosylmethionine ribosyltransferase-isomerase QueA [Varunaivibrio sulfuroxidans]|uniref:S-adenosylmethionine:tRNA ribosyltransferase-isomerase n=1 Tax=Varunaivibrio sulfuroxidans TaxID=1773489 RepID=A0A4R3J8R8_9PROT|nr:tRNA preQ1(34) S-adenosylmethionine ribosyltransferase-isomerase QueA [Varunaivibrio sulfuroxidans]TCS61775.1 S-adenosylmethionine:tRNA ribosyltransferase-isomerase [Varunaivibrio sulfuroxidans]WES32191.1 tRNA preQ1(34) S-adenosylmethionine ribosyltransferase-isomerase QueA [Varunaivibrio sulfuroxidans]
MKVNAFDFELPTSAIAQHPAEPRDRARLLYLPTGDRHDGHCITDLPRLLRAGDVMVFNDTRVIPARMHAARASGGRTELTLHKQDGPALWRAFARPAKRLGAGEVLTIADGFALRVEEKHDGGELLVRFDREGAELLAALERHAIMPLPPYIKRGPEGDSADRERYQTLFADRPGAVAAPTAGLHFTPALMDAIAAAGIHSARVTLHVGAGTFLPVKADDTQNHVMHSEWGEVSPETAAAINAARAKGGRVVCVGTTSLRLLESATGDDGVVRPFCGDTDIFITPGYRFKAADVLITNFHLPKSTLFMLVCAFSGLARMKTAYAHAIAAGYRFYSYGDACLLERAAEEKDPT